MIYLWLTLSTFFSPSQTIPISRVWTQLYDSWIITVLQNQYYDDYNKYHKKNDEKKILEFCKIRIFAIFSPQ